MADGPEDSFGDESTPEAAGPSGADAIDVDSFSDWLATRADSTGQSESEVLKQLVGAYWQLYEHVETGSRLSLEGAGKGETMDLTDESEHSPAVANLHLGVDHDEEIEKLERELDELRERIEAVQQRAPDAEQVADLQEAVDRHADQLEDLRAMPESVAESEAVAAQAFDQSRALSDTQEDLRADHDELRATVERLEDAFVGEIRNAETILEHLIETTEQNEVAIHSLRQTEEVRTEHSSLVDLKLDALRLGADTASCAACGHEVDPADLTAPACPACEAGFTGIARESEWFGLRRSHRLQTAGTPDPDTDGSDEEERQPEAGDGA